MPMLPGERYMRRVGLVSRGEGCAQVGTDDKNAVFLARILQYLETPQYTL